MVSEARGDAAGLDLDLMDASGGVARLDETLVRQAVANLVRNALVHNIEGGWVRLAVSGEVDEVIIDVVNSGDDLSRELVSTLPEPFVRGVGRTRGRADGTGLGLAIVASIARAHRGRLELWPREGGGLHARLRLPR